ncbi:sugar-phosphatase [Ligilactobacillus equi]|uniref:HAD superfamily hydrolase n=1 Tax=Ligilactobacillus equi DSM 15833 = JCM 10991 TaxID=1423740 RepID=A0A0R1T674_9LACO|nr:sugar-phosphatase [Ligilactobacillus equi]KRL76254.1 HAD superfamily hydrolase [Ligilactobacillus equi DSM 15833 = JCM 10991]
MSEIKLIAIDIDGTLVNSKKELTEGVKVAIKEAKNQGIKVVICTGRPLPGVTKLLKELELDNQDDQYVVCFGGNVVETTSGKPLYQNGISYEDFVDLESIARKKNLHFQVISPDRIYTSNKDIGYYTLYEANLVSMGISYRTPEEMKDIPMVKGMFIDEPEILDPAIADRTYFAPLEDRLEFTKTAAFYYEAYTKGVNKGTALDKLCDILGLTADNVMAIGDEENDIPMLEFAKTAVAMENAVPAVKEVVNELTADNDHDGVAKAIKRLALK